jgi:hypothetical protein
MSIEILNASFIQTKLENYWKQSHYTYPIVFFSAPHGNKQSEARMFGNVIILCPPIYIFLNEKIFWTVIVIIILNTF